MSDVYDKFIELSMEGNALAATIVLAAVSVAAEEFDDPAIEAFFDRCEALSDELAEELDERLGTEGILP